MNENFQIDVLGYLISKDVIVVDTVWHFINDSFPFLVGRKRLENPQYQANVSFMRKKP